MRRFFRALRPEKPGRWLRWEKGRQQTGYDKLLIATGRWPVPFDLYLLRFPVGSEIPPHVDRVPSGRHYRLNVILKEALAGGIFRCQYRAIYQSRRIKLFRSDVCEHSVSRVTRGTRYVLSLGWVRA